MAFNTDFESGDLASIVANPRHPPEMKVFASISSGDAVGVADYASGYLKDPNVSQVSKLKIRILLAAILLTLKERTSCVRLLNTLGEPNISRLEGWIPYYFLSLWRLLVLQLKVKPLEIEPKSTFTEKQNVVLIGDSHLIGMMAAIGTKGNFSYYYVPGLRYSYLSSPQMNLKKLGVSNAFLRTYDCDKIIVSVGEIDTRSVYSASTESSRDDYKYSPRYFETLVQKCVEFLKSLLAPHQTLTLVLPPPPSQSIISNLQSDHKHLIIERMIVLNQVIFNKITELGVGVLEYPSGVKAEGYCSSQSSLVDHAHFQPAIYAELLGFSVKT